MGRCVALLIFFTLMCNLSLLYGKRSTKCQKARWRMEKKDPRFRLKPGIVSCHELQLEVLRNCGQRVLVPKNGPRIKDSDYYEPISNTMTALDQKVTWHADNRTGRCGYRQNVQCTWRFRLSSSHVGHVVFWQSAIEHQQSCSNDYIVVDVFVYKNSSGQTIPSSCVPVPGKRKYCRMEYKMGCGSFCDPTFKIGTNSCNGSPNWCSGSTAASCRRLHSGLFNFSTASKPELSHLKIDYIHVTFISDSSVSCSGFAGMYTAFENGWSGGVSFPGFTGMFTSFEPDWSGDVSLGDNQNEDNAETIEEWLAKNKDYIPGYPYRRKLPDFMFHQTYSSDDRLKIMAYSLQDPVFLNNLKNHTLFGPIVNETATTG